MDSENKTKVTWILLMLCQNIGKNKFTISPKWSLLILTFIIFYPLAFHPLIYMDAHILTLFLVFVNPIYSQFHLLLCNPNCMANDSYKCQLQVKSNILHETNINHFNLCPKISNKQEYSGFMQ